MIQLRWLTRPCKFSGLDGYIERTVFMETVLQYRQYIDHGTHEPNFQWTDWIDVPKIQEELP